MNASHAAMMIAVLAFAGSEAQAQTRAKADVACKPAGQSLQYDCIIRLAIARTDEPLGGINLTIGADMPSMPGAHAVRPVKAAEEDKGTYKARLVLEMHGDWAIRLDLAGPARDRVVKLLRFEPDRVGEAPPTQTPAHGRRRH
jgi:YtkA-like protein